MDRPESGRLHMTDQSENTLYKAKQVKTISLCSLTDTLVQLINLAKTTVNPFK